MEGPCRECAWWNYDTAAWVRTQAAVTRALQGETVRYNETVRVINDGRMVIVATT